jgi:8-oxo-dGTP pyrophosphatase MutT (NUDIX family)
MAGVPDFARVVGKTLDRYRAEVLDASDDLALLLARHAAGDALDDRRTLPGHVTTSAIVLDRAGEHVLLVFHRALGRWLQPGGHWEADPDFPVADPASSPLAASAAREVREETGIASLALHPWHAGSAVPVDVDTHAIPANPRKGEPDHVHFDIRFAFVAPAGARLKAQEAEVTGVAWRPLAELAAICPRAHRRLAAFSRR